MKDEPTVQERHEVILSFSSSPGWEAYRNSLDSLVLLDEPLWVRLREAFRAGYTDGVEDVMSSLAKELGLEIKPTDEPAPTRDYDAAE